MPDTRFLVDANVFIEAANVYYTFERVPGFWVWFEKALRDGRVTTLDFVLEEIEYPSELAEWVNELGDDIETVDASEDAVQDELKDLANWLVAQGFANEYVAEFLDRADPWLIASAKVCDLTVVTQEKLAGAGTKKVKIPNVCIARNVGWKNTFEMLDALRATF